MNRWSYLIAVVLLIAGGAYVLRPMPIEEQIGLWSATIPEAWTTTVDELTTHVAPQRVLVTTTAGKETGYLPDLGKVGGLWQTLKRVSAPPAKVIRNISDAQLRGYLPAPRQLLADDGTTIVRWGTNGEQSYAWNGITRDLLIVDSNQIATLDRAAAPPIEVEVLNYPPELTTLTIDRTLYVYRDREWLIQEAPNRPAFGPRINRLLGMLARVTITDFVGSPVIGLPLLGTVEISRLRSKPDFQTGVSAYGEQPGRTVTVYDAGGEVVVEMSGYPAQRSALMTVEEARTAFADMHRDVAVDVVSQMAVANINGVSVRRNGKPWWRLERRDTPLPNQFHWDVVWAAGRESAPDDVVSQWVQRLYMLAVRDPVRDSNALTNLPAGAIEMTFQSVKKDELPVTIAVVGGELRTASHRLRLADDGEFARRLAPADFLDPRLTRRDPERVAKIQRRIFTDLPSDEVVTRNDNGTWTRTYPRLGVQAPPPVDVAAIDRLVRVLAGATMQDLRLVGEPGSKDDGREILAAPELTIDVRFAANPVAKAANDETDLDLTTAQDWGIALRREGGIWQAVDKDLTVRFTLSDDVVDELRRPFAPGQIFPVVASVVTSVTIARGADDPVLTLARTGDTWTIAAGEQAAVAADETAVRRWFRDLNALHVPDGTQLDGLVAEPAAAETVATIVCRLPAIGGDPENRSEQLTLRWLRPSAQGQPIYVRSDRPNSSFPRGWAVLPGSDSAGVIPSSAASFRQ